MDAKLFEDRVTSLVTSKKEVKVSLTGRRSFKGKIIKEGGEHFVSCLGTKTKLPSHTEILAIQDLQ